MNYAALLVVLLALTFAFPLLVRVARAQGVAQGWAVAAVICGALFVLAWYFIRQRVQRDREARERVERIRAQLEARPDDPESYFADNEHLGDALVRLRRHREALDAFARYLALEQSRGRDLPKLRERVDRLRAARLGD